MRLPASLTPGVYAIIDPALTRLSALETARAAIAGGAKIVQLRDKRGDDRETLALGRAIAAACREAGVPFVLNDRADLAALIGAEGLHLGQDDLPIAEARKVFSGWIGLSTHDAAQAHEASALGADLIAVGPIFPTQSKADAEPLVGVEQLRVIAEKLAQPVVAIGGINCENVSQIRHAGAMFCAVISAICSSDEPVLATRQLDESYRHEEQK